MKPIERLLQEVVAALDHLMDLLCLDPTHVSGSLSESGGLRSVDIVVAASDRDEQALRAQGADVALATLATLIGSQSGLAAVSIQIE